MARSVYQDPGGGWAEKGTQTHQERRIGLDPVASGALRRRREEVESLAAELEPDLPADGFVFSLSPQGNAPLMPDFVTKLILGTAQRAGVDTHLHALRHFMATQAIAGGFDPVTVTQRLGHADPSVTLRVYAHAVEQGPGRRPRTTACPWERVTTIRNRWESVELQMVVAHRH